MNTVHSRNVQKYTSYLRYKTLEETNPLASPRLRIELDSLFVIDHESSDGRRPGLPSQE